MQGCFHAFNRKHERFESSNRKVRVEGAAEVPKIIFLTP